MINNRVDKKSMFILAGLILISCILIFKKFLFGGQVLAYTDIGSDTAAQYLMHYQTIINHLRDGSFSLWNFHNGVGINMFSLNLFDPFLMLLYLLGIVWGSEYIYGMLVYMMIFRILLAGLVVYGYLSCFRLSEQSKVISAYLYAFSGFMVVWGQHYQFGTIAILFPLLLLMVEKALKHKKWHLGVTIACAIVSLCSMYFGYMQLLALGFYVLFRVAWEDKIFSKSGMKRIGCIYGSMILGIGMGLFQLLPSAMMVFGVSGRMGGDSLLTRVTEALQPYIPLYYKTLFLRFFSSNLQGINVFTGYQNYYESPNVFLSVLFIICAVQFVYLIFIKRKHISIIKAQSNTTSAEIEDGIIGKKQRRLLAAACFLGAFLLLVPLGSLIFNGFAYPFSRHTFVCMPFFAMMIAWVLDRMVLEHKGSSMLLLITGIAAIGVYANAFLMGKSKLTFLLAGLTVVMTAALWALLRSKSSEVEDLKLLMKRLNIKTVMKSRTCMCLMLFLSVMGTMVLDSYYSYSYERGVLKSAPSEYMSELYNPSLQEALAYLEETDDSFYRVEKDYNVGSISDCLNALAQDYDGISTYNSTLNSNTVEFFKNIWPNAIFINDDHFSFTNAEMDTLQASLLNVKYVLSKNAEFSAPGYVLLKQFGEIYLYENITTAGLGKFYTNVITTEIFENNKNEISQNAVLAENLICDTLPELTETDVILDQYGKHDITAQVELSVTREAGEVEISFEREESMSNSIQEQDESVYTDNSSEHFGDEEEQILCIEFDLKDHFGGCIYADINGELTNLFSEDEIYHVTLQLPTGSSNIRIFDAVLAEAAPFSVDNIKIYEEQLYDLTSLSDDISISQPEKDSLVTGTAKVSEEGVLMMAIPYEDGWHAYVDGEEVEIHKVNYGFSGIFLEEGEHTIQMEYKCPGFLPGVTCSIFFLLLTVTIWCGIVRKEKKAVR